MKMNKRTISFTFSGLFFCLVQFSVVEQSYSRTTDTINVASWCATHNGTADFQDRSHAFVEYEIYFLFNCEILLGNESAQHVVISFYEWDLTETDELVLRDNDTELTLTGNKGYYGDKSFIFRGPTTIQFTTKDTFSHILIKKFKFLFTVANFGLQCEASDFKCSNRVCLHNQDVVCDGNNNCGDWSDEVDCDSEFMCKDSEFRCLNSKCLPIHKVCNGYNDCGDMTDESVCNRECNSSERFTCQNGHCIWNSELCNNKNDCGDWSDETNCNRLCNDYYFPCSNGRCVRFSKVCDGENDCGDGSDEFKCRICSPREHKCPNGLCIPRTLLCNNHNDCGDYSDERDCSLAENRDEEKQVKTLIGPVIVSSVLIGIVLIVLLSLSIAFCVLVAKSKKANNTAASSDQQSAPSSLIGRMRQSFRAHGQPSAPPLEMATADESASHEMQRAPPLMERIRQSFRSRQPPTVQPPNAIPPSDMRSGNTDRPPIYPNLPTGVDNQAANTEE